MNQPVAEASPRGRARIAGAFYLVNIVSGALALRLRGRLGVASLLVATACYLAVTFLFYGIFRPVNKSLSFTAALFSLVADRISDFQVDLYASDSWRSDGAGRSGLDDLYLTAPRPLRVAL